MKNEQHADHKKIPKDVEILSVKQMLDVKGGGINLGGILDFLGEVAEAWDTGKPRKWS